MKWLLALVAALMSVAVLRAVLGPWQAALVVAPMGVAAVIGGWAIVERLMFDPPAPPLERAGPVINVRSRPARPVGRR